MLNWLLEEKDFRCKPASELYRCPGGKQLRCMRSLSRDPTRHQHARDVARSFAGAEGFERSLN